MKLKVSVTLAVLGLLLAGAAAAFLAAPRLAAAAGPDDGEPPITGQALERASAAALDHTGGGRVTETEVGDEDGYYEVEVTLDDGRQVDVHLDQNFNVLGQEADGPSPDGSDGPGDD